MDAVDGDCPVLSRRESEIVLHAQRREHLLPLWHQNDPRFGQLMRHAPVDAFSPQSDRAVGDRDVLGWKKARDGAQRRGFPRTIGADECHNFAFRHIERHALDCGRDAIVDDLKLTDLQQWLGHRITAASYRAAGIGTATGQNRSLCAAKFQQDPWARTAGTE